jgi:hypothetical protein
MDGVRVPKGTVDARLLRGPKSSAADSCLLKPDECGKGLVFGLGLIPSIKNNQLRTGADKGNPTV